MCSVHTRCLHASVCLGTRAFIHSRAWGPILAALLCVWLGLCLVVHPVREYVCVGLSVHPELLLVSTYVHARVSGTTSTLVCVYVSARYPSVWAKRL